MKYILLLSSRLTWLFLDRLRVHEDLDFIWKQLKESSPQHGIFCSLLSFDKVDGLISQRILVVSIDEKLSGLRLGYKETAANMKAMRGVVFWMMFEVGPDRYIVLMKPPTFSVIGVVVLKEANRH